MKVRSKRRRWHSITGMMSILVVTSITSSCSALSVPRGPYIRSVGEGSDLNGGGKSPPSSWSRFNGEESDDDPYFNLAHFWVFSSSSDEDDEHRRNIYKQSTQAQDAAVLKTRGGNVAVKQKPSNSSKNIAGSINDTLDSIQNLIFRPFQLVGRLIPPLRKKEDIISPSGDQEQVLRSTKILSVTAPESDLLPQDIITQSATEAELVGGTLNPKALELTATAINRWYADNGYVLNSVTGATLIPSATENDNNEDESSAEGRVELKVKEVKLAKTSSDSSFPVKLQLVEPANSDSDASDQNSHITLPSQSSETPTFFKRKPGSTQAKKIARITKLEPGSHLRIIPDRWSRLVAFPGGIFGAGGGRGAIFSNIHALRPIPEKGNTVSVEVIATENSPYAALEYGVTKSLYSDRWEGEFDLKHINAFGGGEVATINVRKGQGKKRKNRRHTERDEDNKWAQRLNDGPLSWRISIKDSHVGYDLNLFHENVGASADTRKQQIESVKYSDGSPMRIGGTMRLRLPSSVKRKFKASVVSTTFERINAQSIASATVGLGPYRCNPVHSVQSFFSGSVTSGVTKVGTGVVPYAAGTLTSHQVMPLGSSPINLAVRYVAAAGTKNLPRHEAVSLGITSKVRGYKYSYQSQLNVNPSTDVEEGGGGEDRGTWHALKKICSIGNSASVRPQIATSKALSGTMELRVPQPIFSGTTFLIFGDWSLTKAHTVDSGFTRVSSAGVGLRKVVQGIPLKVDACVTEHGSRGVFFGIGGQDF